MGNLRFLALLLRLMKVDCKILLYHWEILMKKIIAGVSGFTLVALLLVVGTTAHLQGAASSQPVTVRGKMSGLNDQNLIVATNSGVVLVQLTETTKFVTEAPIKLSEIKSGLYLGTTAQKQADGTFLASEVHVFADDERGLSEGHRPSSSSPTSTMTNANVERVEDVVVQDIRGPLMTLRYKDGEVKVFVPPDVPITKRLPGDRSLLKTGAVVSVQALPGADGVMSAAQVTIRNLTN
jgi:hypothetical protein